MENAETSTVNKHNCYCNVTPGPKLIVDCFKIALLGDFSQ